MKDSKYVISTIAPVIEPKVSAQFTEGLEFSEPVVWFNFKPLTAYTLDKTKSVKGIKLLNKITLRQNDEIILAFTTEYTYMKRDNEKFDAEEITDLLVETRLSSQSEFNYELNERHKITYPFYQFSRQSVLQKVKDNLARLS